VNGIGRLSLVGIAMAILSAGRPAAGQGQQESFDYLAQDLSVLGANAIVGGLTGAIRAVLEGRPVASAFARGALGGSVVFAGKALASRDGSLAPPTGRILAGIGTSIVLNSHREALLDTLYFSLGPVQLRSGRGSRLRPQVSVAINDAVALARIVRESETEIDWGRSLSALTPVFQTKRGAIRLDGGPVNGFTSAGTVVLDGTLTNGSDDIFRHEVVHVIQHQFSASAWSLPVESWALSKAGVDRWIPSWLEFNMVFPSIVWAADELADGNGVYTRIVQAEAEWFERR
jgi:hypothetical protein